MQVTVDELSSVKKALHIEIPEKEVVRELDKAYDKLKRTAKIKGFRPGKAPRGVLERRFHKDVNADVTSKLIQDSFLGAIKEKDLKIVGNPEIDPPELDPKGPYSYTATVEIQPDIADIDFKEISLKKTRYTVGEEEIDAQLKMLQKNLAQQKPIEADRGAAAEDFVLIDYEGFKDGSPLADLQKTENFTLHLGDATIAKEFDDGLVGMKKGEAKTIEVPFAEDHANKNLAGHTIRFDVTLNEIREEILPAIDDDLAKQLGKYETLDDLKKDIVAHLEQGYEKRAEQEISEQVFEAILARTQFDVPDAMIDYELEGIIADAERSFMYHHMSMEEVGMTREKLAEKYRDTAEKQVRRHLILNRIVEQEGLELSDEQLNEGFEEMARSINQPAEEISKFYKGNPEKLDYFKQSLLEKNAVKLILESNNVETVEPLEKEES